MKDWSEYKPEAFEYNGRWIKNWFSNMVLCDIKVDGIIYPSVENYYQAMKINSLDYHLAISMMSPQKAKASGRNNESLNRSNWDDIKYDYMKVGLIKKFAIPKWKDKLLATGDDMIIEWNNWRDRIWGVDIKDCKGQNLLGQALMEIREAIK